jgi:ring-1,2-phenylacetyl-CoA epoxidase subunit PaaB
VKIVSLDPRVNRMELQKDSEGVEIKPSEEWNTFEVFHQKKKGQQHTHVGIVHAPNPEMAIVLAKESFGRRGMTTNIWVVKSAEIYTTSYEDSDIFETTPEKLHREAAAYKTRDKIEQYREEHNV